MRGSKVVLGSNKSLGSKRVLGRNLMYSELPSGSSAYGALADAVIELYGASDLGDVFPFYEPTTLNVTDSDASANVTVYNGTEACGRFQGIRTTGTPLFASQPNAARRFTANTLDGHDGLIATDSGRSIFGTTTDTGAAPITQFYQIRTEAVYSSVVRYHMMLADAPTSETKYNFSVNWSNNVGRAYAGAYLQSQILAAGTMYYITNIFNGVSSEVWVNGVLINSGTTGTETGFDVFSLGYLNVATGAPIDTMFAKMGWIDRAASTADRETIEAWTSATGAG